MGLGLTLGLVLAGNNHNHAAKEYALVITFADGNEYAIDHGLSLEDCSRKLISKFDESSKGVECKPN